MTDKAARDARLNELAAKVDEEAQLWVDWTVSRSKRKGDFAVKSKRCFKAALAALLAAAKEFTA